MNWQFIGGPNRSLVSADCDSQDKNLVGSLDRFAKMADSSSTHVYLGNMQLYQ